MTMLTFDEAKLTATVMGLGHRERVAFALCCTERLFPNYLAFQREVGWGASDSIRSVLDTVWDWLLQGTVDRGDVARLASLAEEATPNTEDFDTILVSSALDVATSTEALLRLLVEPGVDAVVEVATYARDTVDMYVQELEEMPPQDPQLEERIRLHPLMQAELRRQAEDLDFLSRSPLTDTDAQALFSQRRNPGVSVLGLS